MDHIQGHFVANGTDWVRDPPSGPSSESSEAGVGCAPQSAAAGAEGVAAAAPAEAAASPATGEGANGAAAGEAASPAAGNYCDYLYLVGNHF